MIPTPSQQDIWVACKAGGEDANRSYNECWTVILRGRLNQEALEAALRTLFERHEGLRCGFAADGEGLVVAPAPAVPLARLDLSSVAAPAQELEAVLRREVETPFDLEQPPLSRSGLFRLAPDVHVVAITSHYVVCDGWSAGVLARELAALYRAGARAWPAPISAAAAGLGPAPSFRAYLEEQRARTIDSSRAEAFWVERLAGELKPIELPIDRPRPARRTYTAARRTFPLQPALVAPLRRMAEHAGGSLLATFVGAVQVWLSRLTGQRDLVIAVPAADQASTAAATLAGHAAHMLPIRCAIDPGATFESHLASAAASLRQALEHRQIAFGPLLRRLRLPFDPSRAPLTPVCVNLEPGLHALDFGDLAAVHGVVPRAFETFELFINAVDQGDRIDVEWSYNTALFDPDTIARWMGELETMLGDAVSRPQAPIRELAVLTAAEVAHLAHLNDTRRPLPGIRIHRQIAARAREQPDRTAVRFGGGELSYGALERAANQLARRLQREDVAPRQCVGVYLNRSERLPAALLAVLKCGASYVPMDPGYPRDRLAMMAEDAGVRVVITQSDLLSGLPSVDKAICLDTLAAELDAESSEPLDLAVSGDDRAYVLFTSGSTGRPKGVEVPHRALENFLGSMQRQPGFAADDRLLAVTTISFDIAGLELFLPLVTGGTVVLADRGQAADPEIIARLLDDERITVMQATPATWRMLIDAGWKGKKALRVLCGGEALSPGLAGELTARAGELWNMYGPTETTVWSTVKRITGGARITIGRPIDNTTVYVLDDNLARVPLSSTGEIWIGGEGVALGYMGRPDLTRDRFVPSPFVPGERMYRTGDLGRVLPDGELECLGRGDSQVKIRGFRIELGDIETAIERCGDLAKAVVLVDARGADPQLVAYWVPEAGRTIDLPTLKGELQKILPPYMLPQYHVPLDGWPLTPAGKIDRKALPPPQLEGGGAGSSERLRDDIDVAIAEIWQELLGVREVGLDDDFFALGGQSLRAVRFVAAVKAKLGVPFSLATVFASPSLREIADVIRGGGGQLDRGIVTLRREPGAARLFFICGVHLYREAALAMGAGIESYGVLVSADDQLEKALQSNVVPDLDVGVLVREYIEAIRRVQPSGPYRLAGVSFGGVLAYEVARQLQEVGESVDVLGLIDPVLPTALHRKWGSPFDLLRLRKIGQRFTKALARTRAGRGRVAGAKDTAAAGAQLDKLRGLAYDRATAAWADDPQPYAGDAVLFRAADRTEYRGAVIDPDLGWGRLVRGLLDIHQLTGDHLGVLQRPNVERLAEILGRRVREAARAETSPGPASRANAASTE